MLVSNDRADWIRLAQRRVADFMLQAGQDCPEKPTVPSDAVRLLRINLIREELNELMDASQVDVEYVFDGEAFINDRLDPPDLVKAADAIADLLYVVLGAAAAWGIDIEPVFREVQRSNMSKFIDGQRREDGKWVKGPSWTPPNVLEILEAQMD